MKALVALLILFSVFSHSNSIAQSIVTIPLNEWSSQRVLSKALGQIIHDSNVPVEYINISVDDQWGALKRGAIHFQIEVWEPSMKQPFEALVAKNEVLDLGAHRATVIEDWWYPDYVEEYCPSLPNWTALNHCIALFKESSSDTKGVYFGGPWDYGDADIIRALGINFKINRLPNGLALWAQLSKALGNKAPIVLLNWSPNWTDKYAQGKFIEFPQYEEKCESDPSWGLNKALVKDCGNRMNGWLKKAASHDLQQNFPCVYQFIEQINFTKEMIVEASALIVVNKLTESQAAQRWTEKFANDIHLWQSNTCLK